MKHCKETRYIKKKLYKKVCFRVNYFVVCELSVLYMYGLHVITAYLTIHFPILYSRQLVNLTASFFSGKSLIVSKLQRTSHYFPNRFGFTITQPSHL